MAEAERELTLKERVRQVVLQEAERHLPDAIAALAKVANDGNASESARVSAARAIVGATNAALTGEDDEPGDLMGEIHRRAAATKQPEKGAEE